MCGADLPLIGEIVHPSGSPPRVRSRRWRIGWPGGSPRITSACAEQTSRSRLRALPARDHLRVCGADMLWRSCRKAFPGSPPRVRSRLVQPTARTRIGGITSACAEQTLVVSSWLNPWWDHLRVCGADSNVGSSLSHDMGSPPRVRSRPTNVVPIKPPDGITSACAEQTYRRSRWV